MKFVLTLKQVNLTGRTVCARVRSDTFKTVHDGWRSGWRLNSIRNLIAGASVEARAEARLMRPTSLPTCVRGLSRRRAKEAADASCVCLLFLESHTVLH